MATVEKFHVRDAFAFEHAICAARIADVFARDFIAHPIGNVVARDDRQQKVQSAST